MIEKLFYVFITIYILTIIAATALAGYSFYKQKQEQVWYYQVEVITGEDPIPDNINKWLKDHPGWEPIYINWGSYVVPHFWIKKKITIE